MPDKIDSNRTGLHFAEESSIGVLPGTPVWYEAEPNSYSDFGGSIATVARSPINASRQRAKGVTTDLDAGVGMQVDFVQKGVLRALQAFFFAKAREKADTQPLNGVTVPVTGVTTTTFTAASGLGAFKAGHIVASEGFALPANNKVSVLSGATATALTTTGLTAEASPPATARVQAVGYQFPSGDVALASAGAALTLTSTAANLNTLGLTPGEWVYLGGDTTATRFSDATAGYARIKSITAGSIVFDQSTFPAVSDAGTGKTLQMFFGKVIRNESDPNLIVRTSLQFERTLGNDDIGVQAEYVTGCVADEMTLSFATADKLVADMSFVGLGSEHRTGTVGVKAGTRVNAPLDEAYNTSSDIVRSYLAILSTTTMNPTPLYGYAQEASISISNGATPNKALGRLGGFDITVGDFEIGGGITAYFSKIAALAAVRRNDSVNFNVICAKQNAGFVFDIPLLTLGDGKAGVEKDGPVTVPLEIMGAENALGYTLLYTHFGYLPNIALPAVV